MPHFPPKATLYTHLLILIFLYSPPTPSLLRKEGAIHRYAEHYESIQRNKSIFMFHYSVLISETKNPLTRSDLIIITETLSNDLPSLRSREGKGGEYVLDKRNARVKRYV